tara:strand:- start:56 stop:478 length:423 start_codon:yes stop_codon:yes gene_type:complete
MKYNLLALFSIVFFSCSNPLEKTYNKVGLEKDIIELKAIVSEEKLNELEGYIAISTQLGVNIVGKTYNELLYDIETSKKNEIKKQNDYKRVNVKELLNQRLKNHICDDYIIEMNKKGIHKHNEKNNDSIEWYEDSYYIDY